MKRLISYASLIALILSLVGTVGINQANATVSVGAVTGNTAADLIVSTAGADYNVVFDTDITPATATTITVTFPAAYTITNGALGAAAVQSCNGTASNICVGGVDVAVVSVAGSAVGKTIIPTIGATDLSTGAGVSFRILTGVQNPAVAGTSGTFTITTNAAGEAAQAGIAGVLITPAAVADLACFSASGGNVWLRWTTPLGATAAYTVKYSLANITTANFNAATTFAQAWATGTVGEIQQQLVLALSTGNLYFFNLKAGGANASLSPVSNTVYCAPPGSSTGSTTSTGDSKAPTSTITAPTAGGGIQAGTPYTIKGTSSDTGGSSVKTVEVSVDGGTTWMTATAVTSTATGFDWQYTWSLPGVGSYTIKSRATDWVGNVETSSAGVTAIVATTLPSFTVDTGGTPPSTAKSTNTDLQVQLDALIAQLKALQAGTSTQQVNLPPGILNKALTLAAGVGAKGNEVTVLQNFLKAQGANIYPEGLVTGTFGQLTLKAVQRFQEKYGIAAPGDAGYGYVGPKTRTKINSLMGL